MPQTIVELLKKGAEANQADKFRKSNLIHLPADYKLCLGALFLIHLYFVLETEHA